MKFHLNLFNYKAEYLNKETLKLQYRRSSKLQQEAVNLKTKKKNQLVVSTKLTILMDSHNLPVKSDSMV